MGALATPAYMSEHISSDLSFCGSCSLGGSSPLRGPREGSLRFSFRLLGNLEVIQGFSILLSLSRLLFWAEPGPWALSLHFFWEFSSNFALGRS